MHEKENKTYHMRTLFDALEQCPPGAVNLLVTVLDAAFSGDKCLISDGSLIWQNRWSDFFDQYRTELEHLTGNGITVIDGHSVFCDTLGREKEIVICGGGHVSIPIIKLSVMMGLKVTVLEDRPLFADNARRAGASRVICDAFENGLKQIDGNTDTYFVIVTRGHRYDQICLREIAKKNHAYIGMMGSHRRVAMVKKLLMESGTDPAVLEQVYTPIGLDIGAETPEEIAVAILAEIIEVKNKKKRTYGFSKEMVKAICEENSVSENKALITIISKKGSAPQGVGVKMLVLPDGTCIGTIGGGCMEAEALQLALSMIKHPTPAVKIHQLNLTDSDAEDAGMVCGGVIDVLFEVITP